MTLHPPRERGEAGEGTIRSSQRERTIVEGRIKNSPLLQTGEAAECAKRMRRLRGTNVAAPHMLICSI